MVWRLRRHPVLYWALALTLAAATTYVTIELAHRAEAARARWGEGRPVVVARRRIHAGEPIGRDDVEVRQLPVAALPEGALTDLPLGQAAATDLYAGEVIVERRLAPAGLEGVAALVPRGARALAIPTPSARPPLSIGDRVDILATVDLGIALPPSGGGGVEGGIEADDDALAPTFAVARAAQVVDVGDDAVTVAVDADDAERVAFAVAQAAVTLALTGG